MNEPNMKTMLSHLDGKSWEYLEGFKAGMRCAFDVYNRNFKIRPEENECQSA